MKKPNSRPSPLEAAMLRHRGRRSERASSAYQNLKPEPFPLGATVYEVLEIAETPTRFHTRVFVFVGADIRDGTIRKHFVSGAAKADAASIREGEHVLALYGGKVLLPGDTMESHDLTLTPVRESELDALTTELTETDARRVLVESVTDGPSLPFTEPPASA